MSPHTNGNGRAPRPRVAFFDFTSCEGCQLTVIDSLQTHPELLEVVEIVEFREASSDHSDDYQIAFIEGSCSRASDEERLKKIRQQAQVVVALGACAHLGGINAIRNSQPLQEVREYVYNSSANWYETYEPRPISAVIAVDTTIPGCPIDREEFISVVRALLQGRLIQPPDYPVCIECKLRENICIFQRDSICLGPVTRAGCNAVCIAYGMGCKGCRGLVSNANLDAFQEVLLEHGLTEEEAAAQMTLFLTNQVLKTTPFQQDKEATHA